MNAITEDECQIILNNYFERIVQYKSHSSKSLLGDVEGYLSDHYNLTINYEDGNHSDRRQFFVKTLTNDETFLGKFSVAMDVFTKESFVYTKFFPELQQLKHYKQINPKCFFSKKNTLVLEDLSIDGYKPGERLKFYDFEQCQKALETLAYYHAYGIIFEEIKSKEMDKKFRLGTEFPKELENKFVGEISGPTKQFIEAAVTTIISLIEEIEDIPKKDHLLSLLLQNIEDPSRSSKLENKFRRTCIHGDLWANNIMFKTNNNEIVDCKLIDFQILNYDLVGLDLELFFSYNTNKSFQLQHKEELLQYYYDCFSSMLSQNDINVSDIYSLDDIKQMCSLKGPEAKIQAIADISLLFLPEEIRIQTLQDSKFMEDVVVTNRSKYVLDVFRNSDEYRKIVTDDIHDLLKLLEAKEELICNN